MANFMPYCDRAVQSTKLCTLFISKYVLISEGVPSEMFPSSQCNAMKFCSKYAIHAKKKKFRAPVQIHYKSQKFDNANIVFPFRLHLVPTAHASIAEPFPNTLKWKMSGTCVSSVEVVLMVVVAVVVEVVVVVVVMVVAVVVEVVVEAVVVEVVVVVVVMVVVVVVWDAHFKVMD